MPEDRTPSGGSGGWPPENPVEPVDIATDPEHRARQARLKEYYKEKIVGFFLFLPPLGVFLMAMDEDWAQLRSTAWWTALMFVIGLPLGRYWEVFPFNPDQSTRSKVVTIGLIGLFTSCVVLYYETR